MVDQKLLDYARNAIKKGFSLDDVAGILKKYGYNDRDIDETLWVINREMKGREEKKAGIEKKKAKKESIEKPAMPLLQQTEIPPLPSHIKPKKIKAIPEIEQKVEEQIQQKFFPEKEKKKHILVVAFEIIFGVIFFALVGILMYLYMWPALLNVR